MDIVDVAVSSMAGLTSQPSANTLYYALGGNERHPDVNIDALKNYLIIGKMFGNIMQHFESGMNDPHTEIYVHEMPGGQYSNLQQQAKAVGLGERWEEVKDMYSSC